MNVYYAHPERSDVRRERRRGNVVAEIQKAQNLGVPWKAYRLQLYSGKEALAATYLRRARVAGSRFPTALTPALAAQNRSEVMRKRGAATRAASTHDIRAASENQPPNGRRIYTTERRMHQRFFLVQTTDGRRTDGHNKRVMRVYHRGVT
jgi:hypothetical protein